MIQLEVMYLPNYKNDWDSLFQDEENACFDLRAAINERTVVHVNSIKKIPLGVKFNLPSNIGLYIFPRSGFASKGLTLANNVGIIDPGYRGELIVPMYNMLGDEWIIINPGDRIVQAKPFMTETVRFRTVNKISETNRGEGGFGSTGIN